MNRERLVKYIAQLRYGPQDGNAPRSPVLNLNKISKMMKISIE